MSLRLQTQKLCFHTTIGDMPLEPGVPAVQATFPDRGSLIRTRNHTRMRAFVLCQPRGYVVLWGGGGSQNKRKPHGRICLQSTNCSVRLCGY